MKYKVKLNDYGYYENAFTAGGCKGCIDLDIIPEGEHTLRKSHKLVNNEWVFDEKRYQELLEEEAIKNDYLDKQQTILLKKQWFDTEYTKEEQKIRRLYTLARNEAEKAFYYDELMALYEEAERVRAEIKALGG